MSSSPLMFDILPSSRRQMEMEEGRGGHHQQHQPRNHQQHHAIILNSFEEDEIEDLTVAHRRLTANSNRYPNSPSVGEGGQMLMTAATPSTSSIAATPVVGNGRGNNNSNANNGSRGEPFEAMTLSQVNISGLRAATDESRQRGRRLVWVLLLTICFAVMVAQITDRVRHFLSEPVSVQVSVTRNASLAYPAISICNKNMFNMTAVKILRSMYNLTEDSEEDNYIASLLQAPDLNALSLWQATKHSRHNVVKECWFGRNVTCDARGHWTESLTTMGVCHTYTLNDSHAHLAGIFHNLYLKIQEKEEVKYLGDSGWKFYLHNPREIPTLGVQTHGTSLYPGQGRDLRLDLKKIWALHHSRNPCQRDIGYLQNNCFFDCFMRTLEGKNITCKLPYMLGSELPFCETPSEYRRTEQVTNDLFFFGQWKPNVCNCSQQCLNILFTSSLESTTDKYNVRKRGGVSRARIRIYYQNLQFEFIKEEVGYGTIDLLCDIGGTLSLLMGASLLTCCELVEVAWCAVVNKCYTGNKKIVKRLSTRRKNHPRKRRPKKSMAAAAASTPSSVEIRRRLSRNSDENNGAGGGNNREPV